MTPQPQSNLDVFGNLPVLPKGGNPFPGLRSFEEDEDYLFFGREKQIDELLRKLRMTRFIAVVGVSGSGKSSLVKCGLIPSLYSGYMALAGSNWKKCVFRPGDDPIGNLAKVLAEPGVIYDDDELRPTYESIIETTLRRSNRGLSEVVRQSELNPKENLLIVVDQFEELFRFSRFEKRTSADKRDSLSFVELLLNASQQASPSIYIVLTMRSDFLGECTSFTGLTEAVNQGQYLVPRMTREERKHAITGPIAVGGADITPRLLTQLLNDVGDNPDQLPILQHALMRTWDYWQQHHPDQPIDIPDYQAIGTMRQALSQHAEEAYNDLKTDRERDICEHLFKALTDKGDERQGTRRPTKMKELSSITQSEADEVATVINVFRDGNRSFLMPPSGVSLEPESIIDISHESLMRIWGRLIRWVDEENQSADIYNRLAEAASLYQDRKSGLWRNPELQFALQWYDEHKPNSAWAKRYDPSFERAVGFLMESKRQEEFEVQQKEKQERQKIRRMRTFTAFLGTAALVSIMLFIYAALKQAQAEENAQVARANALEAEKQTKIAKRQKKVADYEKQQAVLHSQEAETQRQRASEQETLAKSNAALADQRAKDAFVAQKIAEQQEDVAKIKTRDAMISRAAAKKSESKADSLRVLALSRTLAFESQRQYAAGNTEQASLLARQAYLFNRQKDGPELDPDIFNALSKAADDREEFSGHSSGVRAVAAIPGADLFASAGDDMTLRIWDSTKPKEKAQVIQTAGAGNFRSLASSATGKYLAAGDLTGAVTIIERSSGNHASTYPNVCSSSVNAVVFRHGETDLVAGGADGRIVQVSPQNGGMKEVATTGSRINAMAIDGSDVLAVACEDRTIRLFGKNFQPIASVTCPSKVKSVAFDQRGRQLAAGLYSGMIVVVNMNQPNRIADQWVGHLSSVNGVAFTDDGKRLASAGSDQTIRLWDMSSKESITLKGHDSWIWGLQFTGKGTALISCSEDKTLRKWIVDPDLLADRICKRVTRNLTPDEWNKYISNVPYQSTCK